MTTYRDQKAIRQQRARNTDIALTITIMLVIVGAFLLRPMPFPPLLKLPAALMMAVSTFVYVGARSQWNRGRYWFWFLLGIMVSIIPGFQNPVVGLIIMVIWDVMLLGKLSDHQASDSIMLRGQELMTSPPDEILRHMKETRQFEYAFIWGGMGQPMSYATKNNVVVGTVGSGKTLTINMFMRSVFKDTLQYGSQRGIIFDPKGENLSILYGCVPERKVIIMNPFDQRCVAWDMAKDITNPQSASALANILVPMGPNEKDRYWRDTVVRLMTGVVIALNFLAPRNWELRDILIIMQDEDLLRYVLESHSMTNRYLNVLGSDNTKANITSTISTKLQDFEIVAACWHLAERRISLQEWMDERLILLLGESEIAREPLRAINRLIFTRAAQMLLSQPEADQTQGAPNTYIVIDELPSIGKLDSLKTLATKGRSKGVCITVGFQDLEDMHHVYGKEVANTMLGQFNNKAFLRMNSPPTANWACEIFSEHEFMETRTGTSTSHGAKGDSRSESKNMTRAIRKTVMPIELLGMAPPGPDTGLKGYYHIQGLAYSITMPWSEVMQLQPKRHQGIPDFLPRGETDYWLFPFNYDDVERLDLKDIGHEILEDEVDLLNLEEEDENAYWVRPMPTPSCPNPPPQRMIFKPQANP